MKLEKRCEGQPSAVPEEAPSKGKKPVLIYIMILFIAAFLMMALSLAAHQRSNTEALGELQNSVSAMQEVQATQEQIILLQTELADVRKEAEELEDAAADAQKQIDALLALYSLQQHYSNRDLEACRADLEAFEKQGYQDALPDSAGKSLTPPSVRFQELKSAVEAMETEENP